MTKTRSKSWFVYILRCADQTLYTGIAQDTARRLIEHNEDNRLAARYTRARRPVQLVYSESQPTRSAAAQREAAIKQLSRIEKENLIKVN